MMKTIVKKIKTKNWGKTQKILMTGQQHDEKKQVKSFR